MTSVLDLPWDSSVLICAIMPVPAMLSLSYSGQYSIRRVLHMERLRCAGECQLSIGSRVCATEIVIYRRADCTCIISRQNRISVHIREVPRYDRESLLGELAGLWLPTLRIGSVAAGPYGWYTGVTDQIGWMGRVPSAKRFSGN